ncbi:MAG: hypothetical protein AB4911_17235 [Oscillochloridaceae bacterium umkhey_bin13]
MRLYPIHIALSLLLSLSLIVPLVANATPTPASQPLPPQNQPPMSPFGMNTYFTGLERIGRDGDAGVAELISRGRLLGAAWAREELSWGNLERTGKGRWDWNLFDRRLLATATGGYQTIGMLLTTPAWARVADCPQRMRQFAAAGVYADDFWCPPANPQDFADYVFAVVERYDGDGFADAPGSPRVAAWQIGNEPNAWETWPGTPAEYGALLVAGYAAAKAADPTAIVATGGVYVFDGSWNSGIGHRDGLSFLNDVFNANPAAWHSFDALAIHPFMPTVGPDEPGVYGLVTLWGRLAHTRAWLEQQTTLRGGSPRPIWISEIGWSTCTAADVGCQLGGAGAPLWQVTGGRSHLVSALPPEGDFGENHVLPGPLATPDGLQQILIQPSGTSFPTEGRADATSPPTCHAERSEAALVEYARSFATLLSNKRYGHAECSEASDVIPNEVQRSEESSKIPSADPSLALLMTYRMSSQHHWPTGHRILGVTLWRRNHLCLSPYNWPAGHRILRVASEGGCISPATEGFTGEPNISPSFLIGKSEQQQADYLVRSYGIALALGIEHISWFQLEDKFDGAAGNFWQQAAILRTASEGYALKPAAVAYATLTNQLREARFIGFGPFQSYRHEPNALAQPGRFHLRFAASDTSQIDMFWRNQGSELIEVALTPGTTISLLGRDGQSLPYERLGDTLRFTVGESPLYLRQSPPPLLTLSPTVLTGLAQPNGATRRVSLRLRNGGSGTLSWSATTDVGWARVSPGAGSGREEDLWVTLDPAGLAPGIYQATLRITSNGGERSVPIQFRVVERVWGQWLPLVGR